MAVKNFPIQPWKEFGYWWFRWGHWLKGPYHSQELAKEAIKTTSKRPPRKPEDEWRKVL